MPASARTNIVNNDKRGPRRVKFCDALKRHQKKVIKAGCRPVLPKWIDAHPPLKLEIGQYLCTQCRRAVIKLSGADEMAQDPANNVSL